MKTLFEHVNEAFKGKATVGELYALKTETVNSKSIMLYRNEFGNHHIAIWDGKEHEWFKKSGSLPTNYKTTPSYGKDPKDKFLLAKYDDIVKNAGKYDNKTVINRKHSQFNEEVNELYFLSDIKEYAEANGFEITETEDSGSITIVNESITATWNTLNPDSPGTYFTKYEGDAKVTYN